MGAVMPALAAMAAPPPAAAPPRVRIIEITENHAGQRIDNFLRTHLKGVPKSRLYRALRRGEVRVNGARIRAPYPLRCGDRVRIPPLRYAAAPPPAPPREAPVLYEDDHLLVVDKPAGLAVHGGSGLHGGLIEGLRSRYPHAPYLELAHRLDRDTSGCLMLAKSRRALLGLHAQLMREGGVRKDYLALVKGQWGAGRREISAPITRRDGATARAARSRFTPCETLPQCTLMGIRLLTGRMHQARMHAAAAGHPVAGDARYGNPEFNRLVRAAGLRRMFLHASRLRLSHPIGGAALEVHAPLPAALAEALVPLRAGVPAPPPRDPQ